VIAEAERDDAVERASRAEMALERAMLEKDELSRQVDHARDEAIRAAADAAGGAFVCFYFIYLLDIFVFLKKNSL
jgi:hypothetical protein